VAGRRRALEPNSQRKISAAASAAPADVRESRLGTAGPA
jgi:hypothetical protein